MNYHPRTWKGMSRSLEHWLQQFKAPRCFKNVVPGQYVTKLVLKDLEECYGYWSLRLQSRLRSCGLILSPSSLKVWCIPKLMDHGFRYDGERIWKLKSQTLWIHLRQLKTWECKKDLTEKIDEWFYSGCWKSLLWWQQEHLQDIWPSERCSEASRFKYAACAPETSTLHSR